MEKSTDSRTGFVAGIVLLLSLTGGYLFLNNPLESLRPSQEAELFNYPGNSQFVRSRLWQDPLLAVHEHWRGLMAELSDGDRIPPGWQLPYTISNLPADLSVMDKAARVLRIIVMTNGNPYAEDIEERRRQRYALVSALTQRDFVPLNASHVGYFLAPPFSGPSNARLPAECFSANENNCPIPQTPMLIGYETFQCQPEPGDDPDAVSGEMEDNASSCPTPPYQKSAEGTERPVDYIHVFWLDSQAIAESPVHYVAALIARLDDFSRPQSDAVNNVVLGPNTSGELVRMYENGVNNDRGRIAVAKDFFKRSRDFETSIRAYLLSRHEELNAAPDPAGADGATERDGAVPALQPAPSILDALPAPFVTAVDDYLDFGLTTEQQQALTDCLGGDSGTTPQTCLQADKLDSIVDSDEDWRDHAVASFTDGSRSSLPLRQLINKVAAAAGDRTDAAISLLLEAHDYLDDGLPAESGIRYPERLGICLNSAFSNTQEKVQDCLETHVAATDSDSQWQATVVSNWSDANQQWLSVLNEEQTQAYLEKMEARMRGIREELVFLSSRATAPPGFILELPEAVLASSITNASLDEIIAGALRIGGFRSLIHRDNATLRAIMWELKLRGACKGKRNPQIILVSEQDTNYGRLLDDVFSSEANKLHKAGSLTCEFDVVEIGYLRGIDGEIPILQRERAAFNNALGEQESGGEGGLARLLVPSNAEAVVGPAQFDYLARLAEQVKQQNRESGNLPLAIGVLGSDVYDKLLILQALKRRLPASLFFTTDLDTRLYGSRVFDWTRNLLVASSHGLLLAEEENPQPFRDSYQTAFYQAAQEAVNYHPGFVSKAKTSVLAPPRLYEIGRSKPLDITPPDVPGYEEFKGKPPPEATLERKVLAIINERFAILIPVFLLCAITGLRAWGLWHEKQFWRTRAYRLVCAAGLLAFLLGFVALWSTEFDREPFFLFEGISAVPTFLFLMFTSLMSLSFLLLGCGRLLQAKQDMQRYVTEDTGSGLSGRSYALWLQFTGVAQLKRILLCISMLSLLLIGVLLLCAFW